MPLASMAQQNQTVVKPEFRRFQQFDEVSAKQNSRKLTVGDVTMTIYPTMGARIMSLTYKGQEVISQLRAPESFGSTFWISPQKEWNWPPVREFDKSAYQVEEHDGRLVMTSEVSPRLSKESSGISPTKLTRTVRSMPTARAGMLIVITVCCC